MTKQESNAWLEYRSSVTGKSVEELRQMMSDRSKLANKKNSGFASRSPEERKAVSQLGVQARGKKKDGATEK